MKLPISLRIGADMFQRLHAHLFPGDRDEHGAVVAAGIVETERGTRREESYDALESREHTASACAGCGRELKPEHAFGWEDRVWCGSCAPSGASPVELRTGIDDDCIIAGRQVRESKDAILIDDSRI